MDRIPPADLDTLRRLADRWRTICDAPHARWCREQWRRLVDLEPVDRPLVAVQPEGATAELMADEPCTCDPRLRFIESSLRERIRRAEAIPDDTPWTATIDVGWAVSDTGWGVEIPTHHGSDRGSYAWEPPLQDLARDLPRLRHRRFSVDRPGSEQDLALAQEAVGDLLTVQRRHYGFWTVGLTWDVIRLVGLERLMTLMYDDPEGLLALMAWMRDDVAGMMDWYEAEGLLTSNHDTFGIGSGAYGPTAAFPPSSGGSDFARRWGFAESQETVGVSPRLFQRFILPFQVPLMNRFGLVYYGCCEGLERRLQMVMDAVPRLRVVSMAPWADQEAMARISDGRLVLARKPNPTLVCSGIFDEDAIRADIATTLRLAGHRPLCLVLKDTHTVLNQPWRLGRWARLARMEIDRFLAG